jgi:mannose-6-phosphate isomerase-like protein (cupin superfamily)
MIIKNKNVLRILKDEILSFDKYTEQQIRVIEHGRDWAVKDKLTFGQWVNNYKKFPAIKLEGLEKTLRCSLPLNDIHLFYSKKAGYSFKWHKDSVDVILYVIKGSKRVSIKNRSYLIKAGQYVKIPKRNMHRVFSTANTWALSIGLK